jgi:hypothetical protein
VEEYQKLTPESFTERYTALVQRLSLMLLQVRSNWVNLGQTYCPAGCSCCLCSIVAPVRGGALHVLRSVYLLVLPFRMLPVQQQ